MRYENNVNGLAKDNSSGAVAAVHEHLRSLIVNGRVPPGTRLNQVAIASELGVSRTPVREAIRMLQQEGLVEGEPQRQGRVAGFNPGHMEAVYVQRILLESLGARMTAERIIQDDLGRLEEQLARMQNEAERNQVVSWQQSHQEFHLTAVAQASPSLQPVIRSNIEQSHRYRALYRSRRASNWSTGHSEHQAILDALRRRDPTSAAVELAYHLARTALSLVGELVPTYDPQAIRSALNLVSLPTGGKPIVRS